MNLKLIVIGLFVLALGACDNKQPATQQATTSQEADVAAVDTASPAEQTPAPVIEQAVTAVAEPAAPQQTVAAVAQPRSGESIYKTSCSSCHATGAANAPKFGDKAAWKPRIEKGMNVLLQSAINGVPGTAMIKRGTCAKCTDDELKATVEYMVSQSR